MEAVKQARGERQERILDAAEACFVRNGIHRTTMQDIAAEAAMSPGNIYRYYPSKEAVILDLAEREAGRAAPLIEELERAGGRRAAVLGIISRYFTGASRENAVLRLDLWAEATRNPAVAALVIGQEREAQEWFVAAFAAMARSPDCDLESLWAALIVMLKGIVISRALLKDYEGAADLERCRALIDEALGI